VVERRIEAALDGRWLGVERRWVPLERIAEPMRLAVVAAEDQRFPSHGGFDLDAVADALDDASRGRRLRGASTLTQQVAKNLFLWPGRSVVRKAFEAYFTVLLEALWPKRRILEVYLNIVELGPGIFGVEAASQRYFGKPASRLGAAEAARLAAILPNPVKRSAVHPSRSTEQRARWIRSQMERLGSSYVRID
jgi:monofunctional biosynthetic peptidoglycan transglycosylase